MNGRTNSTQENNIGALIPLEAATNLKITANSERLSFNWNDPVDKYTTPGNELVSAWDKTVVIRNNTHTPTSLSDGVIVITETVRDQYLDNQLVDSNLTNGTTYYYSIVPITTNGIESEYLTFDAMPKSGIPEYGGATSFVNTLDPERRYSGMRAGSTGEYIIFAGGAGSSEGSSTGHNMPFPKTSFNSDGTAQLLDDNSSTSPMYLVNTGISSATAGSNAVFSGGYKTWHSGGSPSAMYAEFWIWDNELIYHHSNMNKSQKGATGLSFDNYAMFIGGNTSFSNTANYLVNIELIDSDLIYYPDKISVSYYMGRGHAMASANDNYAIIAGGSVGGTAYHAPLDTVDVFDHDLTRLTATTLPVGDSGQAATHAGEYCIFNCYDGDAREMHTIAYDNELIQQSITTPAELGSAIYDSFSFQNYGSFINIMDPNDIGARKPGACYYDNELIYHSIDISNFSSEYGINYTSSDNIGVCSKNGNTIAIFIDNNAIPQMFVAGV